MCSWLSDLKAMNVEAQRKPLALLVEDDRATRKLIAKRLAAMGFDLVECEDGQSALDYLSENRPDIVCLDLALPIVSGYEVGRRMRENPITKDVPIVAITGRDGLDDATWAREVDAATFIVKPLRSATFADEIRRAMAGRRSD